MAGVVVAAYTKGDVYSLWRNITNLADQMVPQIWHIEIGPVGGEASWAFKLRRRTRSICRSLNISSSNRGHDPGGDVDFLNYNPVF